MDGAASPTALREATDPGPFDIERGLGPHASSLRAANQQVLHHAAVRQLPGRQLVPRLSPWHLGISNDKVALKNSQVASERKSHIPAILYGKKQ